MSDKKTKPAKKGLIGWILYFAGSKKGQYMVSVFFALLSVACCIAPYFIIARIVQQLLAGVRDWKLFLQECGITALFWLGNVLFHAISTSMSHVATFNLLGNIRKSMCDKLTRLPLGTVLDMPSGSLKNIMIERIDSMETTLAHIVPEYTSNIILSIVLVVYLFVLDWRLALACMATLPIGFVAMCFMFKDGPARFKYALDKTKALNDTAVEYINGIEVIKAFGKSKSSYERFVVAAKEGSACYVEWMRDCIWPHAVATVVTPSLLFSLLPIGGFMFLKGTIDASLFITVIVLAVSAIQPFLIAFTYHDDIAKAGAIFGEVGSIMTLDELERPAVDVKKPFDNSIVLKDVRFSYKHSSDSHSGLDPESNGEMLNQVQHDKGEVQHDKGEVQHDNDQVPRDKEILHGISMTLPQGSYTAFVGPSGSGKSTIARAMMKDAPIVILDEATAYTDPENEAIIQKSVAQLVKGKTLIVIAHRLSTVKDADRLYVIKDGVIDSCGTHEELLAQDGLYKKMWTAHIESKDE